MDGWPDDWFRNDAGHGASGDSGPGNSERGPSGEPTVQLPHAGASSRAAARATAAEGGARAGQGAPGGDWPAQPPARRSRTRGVRGGGRGRRIFKILAAIVALVLVGTVGMYFYLDSKLNRVAVFAEYPAGQPDPRARTG